MRILIISSLSPFKSGNYGKRLIDVFQNAGYEVDYLTKYRFEGMTENMYSVYDKMEPEVKKIATTSRSTLKNFLCFRIPFLNYLEDLRRKKQSVIPLREVDPEVDALLLCERIEKEYDVVYVTFWQYMLTTKSLKLIYDKLRVPIILDTVDMYPMTGGCYYFGDCTNYERECRDCPASQSFQNKDIPHENFQYKKSVYESINCVYLCNKWMRERVEASGIIPLNKIRQSLSPGNKSFMVDENKQTLRNEFGLPNDKFILFAGAANVKLRRKGFFEMAHAINIFVKKLKCKEDVLVVLAGNNEEDFQKYFKTKIVHVGFLPTDKLAKMYRASDLYLSSSIEDAGPSMVIQSLLSGTPVVAFNVGIAQEVIINNKTGYIAELGNVKDFAKGITLFYKRTAEERESISCICRENILKKRNPQAFIEEFEKMYLEFRNKNL